MRISLRLELVRAYVLLALCWGVSANTAGFAPDAFARAVPSFADIEAELLNGGVVAWGDYDNDGDLDIVTRGGDAHIYRNDDGVFINIYAGLTGYFDSVAWGDYDNDGDLDLLLAGNDGSDSPLAEIYRNDGGVFTPVGAGLLGVERGSVAWGDYDNDGDLDVLTTGVNQSHAEASEIYRNDDGAFTAIAAGLIGVYNSSVAWGDYDGDGDLDILLTGEKRRNQLYVYVSYVYRNDSGTFTNIVPNLTAVGRSSVAWGDYDNDGDLDILLSGISLAGAVTEVYRNDDGVFSDIEAGLVGTDWHSWYGWSGADVAWGDCDNDGDLDILAATDAGSHVYLNDAGNFTDSGVPLPALAYPSVAWGDYDNDRDLDILLSGGYAPHAFNVVLRNDGVPPNTPPEPPTGLSSTIFYYGATLNWDAAFDAETPAAGLTYNVRMGTSPGAGDILSGMVDPTDGFRLIPQAGIAGGQLSWHVSTPVPGTYYWSVQAIDTSFAGSTFAIESTFEILPIPTYFTEVEADLPPVRGSSVAWGDYDNDGDLDVLITGLNETDGMISEIYRNDEGAFAAIGAGLTGVHLSSAKWGDFDNDGDLDIVLAGDTGAGLGTHVYRNDAGTFVDVAAGLPGAMFSSVAWGDYDNDGDLDLLLAGSAGATRLCQVYRNDAGLFVDINAGLAGVAWCSVEWGDYDGDQDLDILVSGETGSDVVTTVYGNNDGVFSDAGANLPGVRFSSVAWGDYDGDGDLDILITGDDGAGRLSRVYRNHLGTFTDIEAGLEAVSWSSAAWGDCDGDGDLDILLTGLGDLGHEAEVYRNDDGAFTSIGAGLDGVYLSSVAWGDYDNDGHLDILMTGASETADIAGLYRVSLGVPNTPPTSPTSLAGSVSGTTASLNWDAAADAETKSTGLTYNLRVGSTPGSGDIFSGMVDGASGYRRVAYWGNAGPNLGWTLELPATGTYYWSVHAIDSSFAGGSFAQEEMLTAEPGPMPVGAPPMDPRTRIISAVPNPFNPQTTVDFVLDVAGHARLEIFDSSGRRVATLVEGTLDSGMHSVSWDGRDRNGRTVASGVYICKLRSGQYSDSVKLVMLK